MSPDLIINGKFLSVPMTGVHRVAHELANALADLAAEGAIGKAEVWLPYDGAVRAKALRLPSRIVGPLRGIPWEQITLPLASRGRLLLNLCNIGPIAATNAVTMIHDAQVYLTPQSYGSAFAIWYRAVQPLLARRHRHILTVSEFSRQQLIAAGLVAPEKISVVHNGVDHILAVEAQPDILDRLALSRRGFVVALASTQPHKNIRLLLRAFCDPALAGLKLVLIGDAGAAAFPGFESMRRDNVVFAGRVSDGELRALYETALCIGFPSTTEGFGLPPVEAMRVGCPAIVAPCGALPEVCGAAAIYADPMRVNAWVQAIIELDLHENLWIAQSRAAASHATQFTWRRAAERLVQILGEVAVLKRQPSSAPVKVAA